LCAREIDVRGGDGGVMRIQPARERGRWIDAALSPDGHWVGANWQGECEVVWGFLASVRDGKPTALVTVDGEPAPSGFVTWLPTGEAVGVWRAGNCGDPGRFGVYRFFPGTPPRLWFEAEHGFAVW
jgi:hypothetical protein